MSKEIIKKDGVLPQGFSPFQNIDLVPPSSDLSSMVSSIKTSLPGTIPTVKQKGLSSTKSSNALNIASGILNTMTGDRSSKMDPTAATANSLIKGALNFTPWGKAINMADDALGVINKFAGVDPLSGLSTGDKILSSVPIVKELLAPFGTVLDKKNFDKSKVSNEFSFTKENEASNLAGKNVLTGKGKFQTQLDDAWRSYVTKSAITERNKKRLDNDISGQAQDRVLDTMSGGTSYRLVKSGGKIYNSEWDRFFSILKEVSSKGNFKDPKKFQLGGKMNLIPEGALHARKHDIVSVDPELKGQITSKGIPVISKSEGGIVQHAEIEREEWTLRKEFTDQLESLYKKYQEDPSDELAIEAGKLICYELLKNTDDRSGLIKNVK